MTTKDDLPAAQTPPVVDPHNIQTVFVDWIVTGGMFENVVNITLGTIDHSLKNNPGDMPRVVCAAHLRMSRDFAERLHAALGSAIHPDQGQPNPPQTPPPKNKLN